MGLICGLCNKEIPSSKARFCRHCKSPFHSDCLTRYLGAYHRCPYCGKEASLFDFGGGAIDSTPLAERNISERDQILNRPTYRPTVKATSGIPSESITPSSKRVAKTKVVQSAPAEPRKEKKSEPKKEKKITKPIKRSNRKRGGFVLFVLSAIIAILLIASAYYAQINYVGYSPYVEVDEQTKDIIPGQVVEYSLTAQNSGNMLAKYVISIDSVHAILPDGWDVWIADNEQPVKSTSFLLEPEESMLFSIRISSSSSGASNAQASVPILVSSQDGKYSSTVVLIAKSVASYNFTVEQGDNKKYISAGETAQFSASIHNVGTSTDTYLVQLIEATYGWNSSITQDKFTIGPGQSSQVIFTLQSPATAIGNEQGTVSMRVVSQKDPSDVKTLQYSLVVNPTYGFEILASENSKVVLSGSSTTYIFKVRNVGNTVDTYSISTSGTLPIGWTTELSKTLVTINNDDDLTLSITFSTPESAPANLKGTETVTIQSQASGDVETQEFNVTIAQEQDKYILVELFTSVNCTYCPFAEEAVELLDDTYPNKFIVLAYHTNDSFQNAFTSSRFAYYTLPGNPSTVFDGTKKVVGGTGETYSKYVQKVGEILNEDLTVRIEPIQISDSVTEPGKSLVKVLLKPKGTGIDNSVNVIFAAYRNGLSPSSIQSKVYNYVVTEGVTKIISDIKGERTVSAEISIPSDGGLVVFIQDRTTKQIYQSIVI